jgi:hypothetical protein
MPQTGNNSAHLPKMFAPGISLSLGARCGVLWKPRLVIRLAQLSFQRLLLEDARVARLEGVAPLRSVLQNEDAHGCSRITDRPSMMFVVRERGVVDAVPSTVGRREVDDG